MLLKNMLDVKKKYILCILIGGYLALVLWITLFSRFRAETRSFLLPFHSYVELFNGNNGLLFENIENIILFIPLAIVFEFIGITGLKRCIVLGFFTSLSIEIIQYGFVLGTFEFDDLMHNTFGLVIGYYFIKRTRGESKIKLSNQMKGIIFIFILIVFLVPFGYGEIRQQKMVMYASLYDREDGVKNLLVLDGKNGNVWNTNVYVEFLQDGSIRIKGTADKTSWWPIGKISLEPGRYSFSGLSGVEKNTVGLELETNNQRFAPDVGPIDEVRFTIKETTKLMIYVIVYNGCECDVVARPVIYKEG